MRLSDVFKVTGGKWWRPGARPKRLEAQLALRPLPGHPCQLTTQEPECGEGTAGDTFARDAAPWGGGSLAVNESPSPGRSLKMDVSALTYSNQPTGPPSGKMHSASRARLASRKSAPGRAGSAARLPRPRLVATQSLRTGGPDATDSHATDIPGCTVPLTEKRLFDLTLWTHEQRTLLGIRLF